MNAEVVGWDDDQRPSARRGALVALAVVALLAGVAVVRTRGGEPSGRPTPSPGATRSFGSDIGGDPVIGRPPEPDPFFGGTVERRPAARGVRGVLLPRDVPGFITSVDPNVVAVAAAGGPEHAQVLVGWCPSSRIFQDATGTYRYDAAGQPYGDGARLPTHGVRPHAGSGTLVDIAPDEDHFATGRRPAPASNGPAACPATALVWPPLPARTERVELSSPDARRIRGRYVVTTESRAFCPAAGGTDCRSGGWEVNDLPSLPPDDLAGEYVWSGEFVVQADGGTGTFRALRLPEARLVRRGGVGVAAVDGVALAVRVTGGTAVLRFRPFGHAEGGRVTMPKPDRDYVLRPDVALFLGGGRTGLGLPHGTPETLRRYLADRKAIKENANLWLILDAGGRVLRVVADEPVLLAVDEVAEPS